MQPYGHSEECKHHNFGQSLEDQLPHRELMCAATMGSGWAHSTLDSARLLASRFFRMSMGFSIEMTNNPIVQRLIMGVLLFAPNSPQVLKLG